MPDTHEDDYTRDAAFLAAYKTFTKKLLAFNDDSPFVQHRRVLMARVILQAEHVLYGKQALLDSIQAVTELLDQLLILKKNCEDTVTVDVQETTDVTMVYSEEEKAKKQAKLIQIQAIGKQLYQDSVQLTYDLLNTNQINENTAKHARLLKTSLQVANSAITNPSPKQAKELEPVINDVKEEITLTIEQKIYLGFNAVFNSLIAIGGLCMAFCPLPFVPFLGAFVFLGGGYFAKDSISTLRGSLFSHGKKIKGDLQNLAKTIDPPAEAERPAASPDEAYLCYAKAAYAKV